MDFYKEWLGIPEGPRPPDHYELLRCRRFEDDLDKIRAHYKKLNAHVRKYATGQFSVQSQELLNELAKAMLCLTDPERKREYDESLGREFEPERDEFGRLPLLDVLVQHGDISREQKQEVEEFAERRGLSIRDAVVQMKLVPPDVAARALARQLGFSFVDLEDMVPEDDALDRVPRSLVKTHSFIPLFIDDDRLLIACTDEIEHELEDELRLRFGVPVRPVLATPRAINQAIAQYYAPGMRDEARLPAAAAPNNQGAKSSPSSAAGPKSTAAPRQPGELHKPLLIGWSVILAAPILLRMTTLISNQMNLWFIQMDQTIPFFGAMTVVVPLLGGAATFAYIQFVLKKKK
jgi:hypothetical protein